MKIGDTLQNGHKVIHAEEQWSAWLGFREWLVFCDDPNGCGGHVVRIRKGKAVEIDNRPRK